MTRNSQTPVARQKASMVAAGMPLSELERLLQERIKELECLYAISSLREQHMQSIDQFLQGVVNYLPKAWQYPQYACARIINGEQHYVSEGFQESRWRMAADVRLEGKVVGSVEVFYRKGVSVVPGGPFLEEEGALIRSVAERVSTALLNLKIEKELVEAHKMLRSQHQALQETNIALRSVLSRLEDDKREIRASILANIQKIIMPIVFELELAVSGRERSYVTLLRQSLQEIASPFLSHLSRSHLELTPTEVAISTMIRNGLSTKEIAQLRCVSEATVRRHRENIRDKLGLRNRKANLVTYLQSATDAPASSAG